MVTNMKITVDELAKRVQIWVTYEEKNYYKNSAEYQRTIKKYKNQNFDICVYIGGNEPLLPNISALLDEQGVMF